MVRAMMRNDLLCALPTAAEFPIDSRAGFETGKPFRFRCDSGEVSYPFSVGCVAFVLTYRCDICPSRWDIHLERKEEGLQKKSQNTRALFRF